MGGAVPAYSAQSRRRDASWRKARWWMAAAWRWRRCPRPDRRRRRWSRRRGGGRRGREVSGSTAAWSVSFHRARLPPMACLLGVGRPGHREERLTGVGPPCSRAAAPGRLRAGREAVALLAIVIAPFVGVVSGIPLWIAAGRHGRGRHALRNRDPR